MQSRRRGWNETSERNRNRKNFQHKIRVTTSVACRSVEKWKLLDCFFVRFPLCWAIVGCAAHWTLINNHSASIVAKRYFISWNSIFYSFHFLFSLGKSPFRFYGMFGKMCMCVALIADFLQFKSIRPVSPPFHRFIFLEPMWFPACVCMLYVVCNMHYIYMEMYAWHAIWIVYLLDAKFDRASEGYIRWQIIYVFLLIVKGFAYVSLYRAYRMNK